jgi:hypothetical protein
MSAPFRIGRGPDPRLTITKAGTDFIERVMAFWDDGQDTEQIAGKMFEHEHVVAWAVRVGREQRR